jgi:anti-sigma B factor antagonist
MHRVRVDTGRGVAVVNAEGELDAYAAPELTDGLAEVADAPAVVLDLSRVSFMDSTVLGLVVRAVRELGERKGEVRVVLPRTSARRIFELTMLDQVLPVAGSLEDALAELSGGASGGRASA